MNTFTRNKEKYESSIRAISDICSRVLKESKRTMNQVSDSGACSRLLIHFEETLEQDHYPNRSKNPQLPKLGFLNREYPDLPTKYGAPVEKQNQGIKIA